MYTIAVDGAKDRKKKKKLTVGLSKRLVIVELLAGGKGTDQQGCENGTTEPVSQREFWEKEESFTKELSDREESRWQQLS